MRYYSVELFESEQAFTLTPFINVTWKTISKYKKVTNISLELSDLRIWKLQKDAGTADGLNENTSTCKSFS